MKSILKLALPVMVLGLLLSSTGFAQSHRYLNTMRSSTNSHIFVSQSVDGEFGEFMMEYGEGPKETQKWKGYGLGTNVGIELLKFVQFNLGHNFVNLQNTKGSLESLRGSRLNLGTRFVFLSPIGNLEFGGGLLGSRLDYQKQLEHGSYYGSGMYYTVGMNYFINSKVSFFGHANMNEEHMIQNNGSATIKAMDYETTLFGLGFRIWL